MFECVSGSTDSRCMAGKGSHIHVYLHVFMGKGINYEVYFTHAHDVNVAININLS